MRRDIEEVSGLQEREVIFPDIRIALIYLGSMVSHHFEKEVER